MNYIYKNDKVLGPFNDEKIIELLESHTIFVNDYVYSNNQWSQVLDLQFIKQHYNQQAPTIIPSKDNIIHVNEEQINNLKNINPRIKKDIKIPKDLLDKQWFILRKNKKYGPFKYLDIVKMLNSKSLFDHDFIWNKNFKSWNKISDLKAFSSYYINQIKAAYLPELGNIFFRRKHKRIKYDARVFIHDNESYWTGTGYDLSPRGASVTLNNKFGANELIPGDVLNIHFKSVNKNIPNFNAKCEIVSKWYKNSEFKDSPLCYSFKFNNINKEIQDFLTKICSEEQLAA